MRANFGVTLPTELLESFKKYCFQKGFKHSRVIEALIRDWLQKELESSQK